MRQYPSPGEKSRRVNTCLRLQQLRIRRIQVADLAFHTCFGNFCKVEKRDRRAVDKNTNGKKQSKDSTGKIFLQKKGIFHHKSLPLSNCLLWSVDHAAILCCWPIRSLADSSRVVSCDVVALLLSSIPSG